MKLRNAYELELMRQSGQIAAAALKKAIDAIKVGITGLELDKIAQEEIYRLGGDLSYKTVPGYKHATCVTINEQVVHGVPTDVKISSGDLISIDLAVMYKGWHTDCARCSCGSCRRLWQSAARSSRNRACDAWPASTNRPD